MKKLSSLFLLLILSLISTLCFAYGSDDIPPLPNSDRQHYVIYREGYRGSRVEVCFFNSNETALSLTYGRGIELNAEVLNDEKWCLRNNNWVKFEENRCVISNYATEFIASDINLSKNSIVPAMSKYTLDTTAYGLNEYAINFNTDDKTLVAANGVYTGASLRGFKGYRYYRDIDLYGNTCTHVPTELNNNSEPQSNPYSDNETYSDKGFFQKENDEVILYNSSGYEILRGSIKQTTAEHAFTFSISDIYDKWDYKIHGDYMILETAQGTALISTETCRIIFNGAADELGIASKHDQYLIKSGNNLSVRRLSNNDVLIEFTNLYKEIQPFEYGIAKVKTNNGCNFINAAEEKIFKYDLNEADVNSYGIFRIMLEPTHLAATGEDFSYPYWKKGRWAVTRLTEPPICIKLNETFLPIDVNPKIINDRVLIPVRTIFESFGANVSWNEETGTVTAVKDDTTVTLTVNNTAMYINNIKTQLDVPATQFENRVFIPIRALAEALNCTVSWNDITNTVIITR